MKKRVCLLLTAVALMVCFSGCGRTEDVTSTGEAGVVSEISENVPSDSWEDIYRTYIAETTAPGEFEGGMALLDLNEDGTPELFSLDKDMQGFGYILKDGDIIGKTEENCFLFCDYESHYESLTDICGVYRNKMTHEKTIISYTTEGTGYREFNLVTFDGDAYHVEDARDKQVATIMQEYVWVDEAIHLICADEKSADKLHMFDVLTENYKENGNKERTHATAEDGELVCFVKNMDYERKEILLIPAAYITSEEYELLNETDQPFTLDGIEYVVTGAECRGSIHNKNRSYSFETPFEGWDSIIEGYHGKEPLAVEFSPKAKVTRIGLYGEDKENIETYFQNIFTTYAENHERSMAYKAVIQNGVVQALERM